MRNHVLSSARVQDAKMFCNICYWYFAKKFTCNHGL